MIQLKYKAKKGFAPTRATDGSAGWDLRLESWDFSGSQGVPYLIRTGVCVEVPENHVGLVFIRSSVGRKGWSLANSVGVIDRDYRGEILLYVDPADSPIGEINVGDRIAQLVIVPCPAVQLVEVDELSETNRGEGGFGSTGVK